MDLSQDRIREDAVFLFKIGLVVLLGLSIVNDVPDLQVKAYDWNIENGKCKVIDGASFCFNTWHLIGFDTGLLVSAYSNEDLNYFDSMVYVFERESDLLENQKTWSNSNVGKNFTGKVPDYNISLTGVE